MSENRSASGAQPRPREGGGEHEAPEGAPVHPLIDLNRDPTPGKPDHARHEAGQPEDDQPEDEADQALREAD